MKLFDRLKRNKTWDKLYTKEEMKLEIPDTSIYDLFTEQVAKFDKLPAIDYFGKNISYHHLKELVDKCARSLQYEGIEENDVVTICMPNVPEALIAFFAINKVGAIANMIHPLSGEEEISYYLTSTNSKMLFMIDISYEKVKKVISRTNVNRVIVVSAKDSMPFWISVGYFVTQGYKVKKPKGARYLTWEDFMLKSYHYPKNAGVVRKKEDIAAILHSGGTTGNPKGILITNQSFNYITSYITHVVPNVKTGDSLLAIMPNFHGFGLAVCLVGPLSLGAKIIMIPQFSPKTFGGLITKHKPNIIVGVPTLFGALIDSKLKNEDLSYVKYCVSGGDSLSEALYYRLKDFLREHGAGNADVLQGYGMTECLAVCSVMRGKTKDIFSIGVPLYGNDMKIVVPGTQEEVKTGESGEICLSGPSVMVGYLNNKKETNEVLQIHKDKKIWLHTGDSGYMTKDGIFHFELRIKRMIVSSGYNVYPSHIEEVLERHPAVLKSTVIGIPHKYKVQVAKAYIVLDEGFDDSWSVKKSIKEHCEKYLASYSVPYDYEFRKSLPTTRLGKINFKQLEDEALENMKNGD